jgi:hypothetical protein
MRDFAGKQLSISVKANAREARVKARSAGRSQNRQLLRGYVV